MFKVKRTFENGESTTTTFRYSTREEMERWVEAANRQFVGTFELEG